MYKYISKSYNELHKEEQLIKLKIIKENLKIIPPLLDVGCGTGISTNYFKVKSIGIDNCKEMLKQGKNNLIYAEAENLPFEDNSFNTIISATAFHNFKDMEKALKEIIRVSKNNNIAITFLKRSKKLNQFKILLKKYFKTFKEIISEKDIIFVIRPQQAKS
ncbi:class I SAM-dependent methyltransferase [archaeon]|nr:class I SAM-dependent methyltransferase [archaeon]